MTIGERCYGYEPAASQLRNLRAKLAEAQFLKRERMDRIVELERERDEWKTRYEDEVRGCVAQMNRVDEAQAHAAELQRGKIEALDALAEALRQCESWVREVTGRDSDIARLERRIVELERDLKRAKEAGDE